MTTYQKIVKISESRFPDLPMVSVKKENVFAREIQLEKFSNVQNQVNNIESCSEKKLKRRNFTHHMREYHLLRYVHLMAIYQKNDGRLIDQILDRLLENNSDSTS